MDFLVRSSSCVSIFTITIMSIEQYFALVRPLSRTITMRRTWYMIGAVWIVSTLMSMGPVLGWGHFEYNSSTLSCGVAYPRSTSEKLYLLFLVVIAYAIPLLIMAYAYIRIFFHGSQAHRQNCKVLQGRA